MKTIRSAVSGALLLALAACGGSRDDAEQLQPEAESSASTTAPSDTQATPDGTLAAPVETPVTVTIPQSIQGRWGMVPADCTSTKGDTKGLLTITPTRLQFYESVGTLTSVTELAPKTLRADFDFTGEGMEWHREQQFEATDDGRTLTRRELGDDAAPGPFRYTRCS